MTGNGGCARRGRALQKEISGFHNQSYPSLAAMWGIWGLGKDRAHVVIRLAARPNRAKRSRGKNKVHAIDNGFPLFVFLA